MQTTHTLSARRVRESDSDTIPRIELRSADAGLIELDGADLAAQYQLPDASLVVFATDDVPYEETLRIYLLSERLRVLDGLEFSAMYATGTLNAIVVLGPNVIEFSFMHRQRCRLTVEPRARWRAPLLTAGVRRRGGWQRRYLDLSLVG